MARTIAALILLLGAELTEAVASAGPRLARALEADQRSAHASSDRLTGLANRRKFDELVSQTEPPRGPREGALVYADLDRFKLTEAARQVIAKATRSS